MVDVSAIVLCGGTSRRMGGTDKTALPLGDSTVLDHLLDALPTCWTVVCVGAERPTGREVVWTREQPPGGGPVAGIAAGLHALRPGSPTSTRTALEKDHEPEVVVVLAGDQPFAGPAARGLVERLARQPGADGATALDGEGRRQPLLTAYRLRALRAALPEPAADTPARALLASPDVVGVPQPPELTADVDTPEELARARRRVHRLEP